MYVYLNRPESPFDGVNERTQPPNYVLPDLFALDLSLAFLMDDDEVPHFPSNDFQSISRQAKGNTN